MYINKVFIYSSKLSVSTLLFVLQGYLPDNMSHRATRPALRQRKHMGLHGVHYVNPLATAAGMSVYIEEMAVAHTQAAHMMVALTYPGVNMAGSFNPSLYAMAAEINPGLFPKENY